MFRGSSPSGRIGLINPDDSEQRAAIYPSTIQAPADEIPHDQDADVYLWICTRQTDDSGSATAPAYEVLLLHAGQVLATGTATCQSDEAHGVAVTDPADNDELTGFVFADATGHRWVRLRILLIVLLLVSLAFAMQVLRFVLQ